MTEWHVLDDIRGLEIRQLGNEYQLRDRDDVDFDQVLTPGELEQLLGEVPNPFGIANARSSALTRNPNSQRITNPTWEMWESARAFIPGVRLGGIYANKPGYHNTVDANRDRWPDNYSIQLAADLMGPRDKARGLDLTMATKQMRIYTGRLRDAAARNDPRLRALREFYGTLNGTVVFGRIKDSERGRWRASTSDRSHLWHIHMSIFTRYVTDRTALADIISVLAGRQENDVELSDDVAMADWIRENFPGLDESISVETALGSTYGHARSTKEYVLRLERETKLRDEAILRAVEGLDTDAVLDAIAARAAEDTARDAALAELVRQYGNGELNAEQVATRVVEIIGERLSE